MPEMPSAARQRYLSAGIGAKEILAMTDDMATAGYYDAAVAAGAPAKTAANWVLGDLTAHCKVLHVPAVLWWRMPCRPGSACMQMD